jgi:hypothetical protein
MDRCVSHALVRAVIELCSLAGPAGTTFTATLDNLVNCTTIPSAAAWSTCSAMNVTTTFAGITPLVGQGVFNTTVTTGTPAAAARWVSRALPANPLPVGCTSADVVPLSIITASNVTAISPAHACLGKPICAYNTARLHSLDLTLR